MILDKTTLLYIIVSSKKKTRAVWCYHDAKPLGSPIQFFNAKQWSSSKLIASFGRTKDICNVSWGYRQWRDWTMCAVCTMNLT
jgi:hypothetical protein